LKRPEPALAEVRPWYCCRYDCAAEQDRHVLLCTARCDTCTSTCAAVQAFPDPETSVFARCSLIDERFLGNIELGTCAAACSLEDFLPRSGLLQPLLPTGRVMPQRQVQEGQRQGQGPGRVEGRVDRSVPSNEA
jgi:hypothetical protein